MSKNYAIHRNMDMFTYLDFFGIQAIEDNTFSYMQLRAL